MFATAVSFLVGDGDKSPRVYVVDGGCTKHIVGSINMLTTITDSSPRTLVRVANNQLLPVVAIGTVVAYVSAVRTKVIDGVRMQKKRRFEFNQVGTELNVKLGRAHNKEAPEFAGLTAHRARALRAMREQAARRRRALLASAHCQRR